MEEIFRKLEKEGKNTVDNIIKWFKESRLIDTAIETEEKIRKMFSDVKDEKNIEYSKLREVLEKLAVEKRKDVLDYAANLAKEVPNFTENAKEAADNLVKEGTRLAENAEDAVTAGASAAVNAAKSAFVSAWKK